MVLFISIFMVIINVVKEVWFNFIFYINIISKVLFIEKSKELFISILVCDFIIIKIIRIIIINDFIKFRIKLLFVLLVILFLG